MTSSSIPINDQPEEIPSQPLLPEKTGGAEEPIKAPGEKQNTWMVIAAVVIILALMITAIVLLMQPGSPTAQIRDVVIIFMALESLIIGIALVILIVQLATLINLLQHEIKPLIDSTSDTVNTLRGTVIFLSDNISEPVIKMNEYLAGLKRLIELFSSKKK